MKTVNSLIPQEYDDFSGINIHEALIFQSRINNRIETLKESQEKKLAPIIEELEILSLALDNHITNEVKRQETEKTTRLLHDVTASALLKKTPAEIQRIKDQGPPFTSANECLIRDQCDGAGCSQCKNESNFVEKKSDSERKK